MRCRPPRGAGIVASAVIAAVAALAQRDPAAGARAGGRGDVVLRSVEGSGTVAILRLPLLPSPTARVKPMTAGGPTA